jgi:signal peptidase I
MTRGWRVAIVGVTLFSVAGAIVIGYVRDRYTVYYTPSGAMEPTILTGRPFIIDRYAYHAHRPLPGDVIVFVPPIRSVDQFVKRVIAISGDRLVIRGGATLRNGRPFAEPYLGENTGYGLSIHGYAMWVDGARLDPASSVIPRAKDWRAPDAVPTGCYVVLGDNRNNSEDSHTYGFLCPGQPSPFVGGHRPVIIGRALVAGS